jgi:hypothetical protein
LTGWTQSWTLAFATSFPCSKALPLRPYKPAGLAHNAEEPTMTTVAIEERLTRLESAAGHVQGGVERMAYLLES